MHHLPTVLELGLAVGFAYVGSLVMLAARKVAGDATANAQSENTFFLLLGFFAIAFAGRFLFGF
jgi:hypothetical protein